MKRAFFVVVILMVAAGMMYSPHARAGVIQDLFESLQKAFGVQGLSEGEVVAGLKEALRIGTQNAVTLVSRVNGYYKNTAIRIRLPESIRKAEEMLRYAGLGATVDRFEQSMNRAAERAAPRATELFLEAIEQITFTDARQILDGPDDAATRYFQRKTEANLEKLFKPIVAAAMNEVGVTRTYRQLEQKLRSVSVAQSVVFDLDQYVTEKAVQGLFVMMAREEAAIRKDPAARVTELLRRVFGNQN